MSVCVCVYVCVCVWESPSLLFSLLWWYSFKLRGRRSWMQLLTVWQSALLSFRTWRVDVKTTTPFPGTECSASPQTLECFCSMHTLDYAGDKCKGVAVTGSAPVFLFELVQLCIPSRSFPSAPDTQMLCIQHSTLGKPHGQQLFTYSAAKTWNSLPFSARLSLSFSTLILKQRDCKMCLFQV